MDKNILILRLEKISRILNLFNLVLFWLAVMLSFASALTISQPTSLLAWGVIGYLLTEMLIEKVFKRVKFFQNNFYMDKVMGKSGEKRNGNKAA